eukprot:TRINITY_DN66428_c8_g4_i1.p3 TRINITY_DN66428_c8_g4~~TRINITY_DN66428_c8_g4_i1.p3  ORF type:complete len:266 (+),score=132.03 TRINITY_DN66428_c8_g4_i1:1370-2167(+)
MLPTRFAVRNHPVCPIDVDPYGPAATLSDSSAMLVLVLVAGAVLVVLMVLVVLVVLVVVLERVSRVVVGVVADVVMADVVADVVVADVVVADVVADEADVDVADVVMADVVADVVVADVVVADVVADEADVDVADVALVALVADVGPLSPLAALEMAVALYSLVAVAAGLHALLPDVAAATNIPSAVTKDAALDKHAAHRALTAHATSVALAVWPAVGSASVRYRLMMSMMMKPATSKCAHEADDSSGVRGAMQTERIGGMNDFC